MDDRRRADRLPGVLYDFSDRRCAEAMQAALVGDAFYAFFEQRAQGPSLQRREAMVRYMDFSLAEATDNEWGICVRLDQPKGSGASVWSRPKTPAAAQQAQITKLDFLAAHLGDDCAAAYQEISRFMSQHSQPVVDPGAWYLSILALAPDCQNLGLGSSLLTPVLEDSDAHGVATYLETFTPRNESFYQRLGYRVMFRIHEPTIGAEYALMQRPPETR